MKSDWVSGPTAVAAWDQDLAQMIEFVRSVNGPLIVFGLKDGQFRMQTLVPGASEEDVLYNFVLTAQGLIETVAGMLVEVVGEEMMANILRLAMRVDSE